MLPQAIEADSTADQLRALVNMSHELNRVIARHLHADADTLGEILDFRDDTDGDYDPELSRMVLQHPNVAIGQIIGLARRFPADLLKNPALGKIIADNDELHLDVPELLSTPGCPNDLLIYATTQGDAASKAYLLLNPELPESVKVIVSDSRIFAEAQERLGESIAATEGETEKMYLEAYATATKPFCVPRFCAIDRSNPAHRVMDQVLCGFPYTSAKLVGVNYLDRSATTILAGGSGE